MSSKKKALPQRHHVPQWVREEKHRKQEKEQELERSVALLREQDAGQGVSTELRDNAYWLGHASIDDEWLTAFDVLDTRGDKRPLVALLRKSKQPRDQQMADLLERYDLVRKRGGQRTPAYNRSKVEIKIDLALLYLRKLRRQGVPKKEAITEAADCYRLRFEVLENAYEGKRGSRRREKALPQRTELSDRVKDTTFKTDLDAFNALVKRGDKGPMLALLCASTHLRDRWMADLLNRYTLVE